MIDPQQLERRNTDRQVIEIGNKVRHQLGNLTKEKGTQKRPYCIAC
jgi:hypothetical protein